MTKLIQQLSFSSSNNFADALPLPKSGNLSHVAALEGGNKRSAVSASAAECFSLCLGAGPLWCVLTLAQSTCGRAKRFIYTNTSVCFTMLVQVNSLDAICGPDVPAEASAPPGVGARGRGDSPATVRPSTPPPARDLQQTSDFLAALLCGSKTSLSGSSDTLASTKSGELPGSHPVLDVSSREHVVAQVLQRMERPGTPTLLNFDIYLTEKTVNHWETVICDGTLYLCLPGVLASGSKESFMALLDFAEERLGLMRCVLCVAKARADRAVVLRTFMFMGFTLLAPGAPHTLPDDKFLYLHYAME